MTAPAAVRSTHGDGRVSTWSLEPVTCHKHGVELEIVCPTCRPLDAAKEWGERVAAKVMVVLGEILPADRIRPTTLDAMATAVVREVGSLRADVQLERQARIQCAQERDEAQAALAELRVARKTEAMRRAADAPAPAVAPTVRAPRPARPAPDPDQVTGKVGRYGRGQLQAIVLQAIRENGDRTVGDLQRVTGEPMKRIQNAVQYLRAAERVVRTGTHGSYRYRVGPMADAPPAAAKPRVVPATRPSRYGTHELITESLIAAAAPMTVREIAERAGDTSVNGCSRVNVMMLILERKGKVERIAEPGQTRGIRWWLASRRRDA